MNIKRLRKELLRYFEYVTISKVDKKDINEKFKASDVYNINTNILYNDGDSISLYLIWSSEFFSLVEISDGGDLNFRTQNFLEKSKILRHVKFITIKEGELTSDLVNDFDYMNSELQDTMSQLAFLIYNIIHLMKDIELDYYRWKVR